MGQKLWRAVKSGAFSRGDCLPEMLGVPVDDYCREQVQPGHAVVLPLRGSVTDFALATDAQCIFEGMMGLALVETDLGAALHVSIKQPIDDEKRALDATYFTQGKCKLMLSWIGRKLLEQLTGRHDARRHRGHGPQDIRPILDDETLSDLAADQAAQLRVD